MFVCVSILFVIIHLLWDMQGDTDTSEIKMSMPEIWIRNPSPMFNHL